MTKYEALQEALKRAGGQEKLALICGVTQPAVSKWLNSLKEIPAEYALKVELATGVSKHDIAPSFYPRNPTDGLNISGELIDDYGNQQPILDKNLNGVAA